MTVRRLAGEMDADEFLEWEAFDRVHTPEAWHRTAQTNAVIYNTIASGKRRTVADFLPPRAELPRPPEVAWSKFRAFAAAHNASLARRGPAAFA